MKMTRTLLFFILCVTFFGIQAPQVRSEQYGTAWRDMETQNDQYTAGRKLSRGIVNIGLGWTEVFFQPRYLIEVKQQRWPAGVLGGVIQGIYFTVLRLGAGVYDVVTFPVPLPLHYAPLITPESPVQRRPQADHLDTTV